MRNIKRIVIVAFIMMWTLSLSAQSPKAYWDFNELNNRLSVERLSGEADTLEGNFHIADGVVGKGIRLDGFTSCIKTKGDKRLISGQQLSIEAWISLGNYPWNWCPVISTVSNENKGYRLQVGPLGQASLEVAIGEQWIACTSANEALPLRTWMHVIGVYTANESLKLYINGELISTTEIHGAIRFPKGGYQIGMVTEPAKPSDIHRTWGTIAQYFGLDGILDELKVYNVALSSNQVKAMFSTFSPGTPDIAPRRLPTIDKNPGRFGAFYTKLKYYPGWDDLWPVAQDPDIVVCFDESPIKLIFWRGIRYGASWVSENENWMSDQSVEAWGTGDNDTEGCFEHMQDRHCRYSHVRIIENTDARVVVHWRYAPTSVYLSTWRPDPKTGWECWIDEYYYIYPDGTAIRKVSWKKGSLGYPRQFQETLALLSPGQKVSDLLEIDNALVADYEGNTNKQSFVEKPKALNWGNTKDYTIQQYQFKSENKPFICFEPGNKMNLRDGSLSGYDVPAGCNHFPVGQARCDGRTTRVGDRPSHATSFPISDPVIHTKGDRMYWNGLYGMNDSKLSDLIEFGRSWAYAPKILVSEGFEDLGYDTSERCYQIEREGLESKTYGLRLGLKGGKDNPVINPAFYVKNWNGEAPRVFVDGKEMQDARVGLKYELDGTDLIVYLPLKSTKKVDIEFRTGIL
ncbi:MAG: LamG domain-containing protein [Bacteroidales bacterium]|nr:LamG domain-containing protein [Bacteroidales bacterium]